MIILVENNILSQKERRIYQRLIEQYGYDLSHFLLEVEEDQEIMDMNDINYVIIVKLKLTHLKHEKTKIYLSRSNSGIWLAEFESDLRKGYFEKEENS